MKRKNKFGKIGMILNLIAIVYHIIPLSLIFFLINLKTLNRNLLIERGMDY